MNPRLVKAVRKYGDLILSMNGQNKILFDELNGSHITSYKATFEGSNGCVEPKEGAEGNTALINCINNIKDRMMIAADNLSKEEKQYLTEEFSGELDVLLSDIKEQFTNNHELTSGNYKLMFNNTVMLDIEIQLVTNKKIINEFNLIAEGRYLGVIDKITFVEEGEDNVSVELSLIKEDEEEPLGIFVPVDKLIPTWITKTGDWLKTGDYVVALDDEEYGFYHILPGSVYSAI